MFLNVCAATDEGSEQESKSSSLLARIFHIKCINTTRAAVCTDDGNGKVSPYLSSSIQSNQFVCEQIVHTSTTFVQKKKKRGEGEFSAV